MRCLFVRSTLRQRGSCRLLCSCGVFIVQGGCYPWLSKQGSRPGDRRFTYISVTMKPIWERYPQFACFLLLELFFLYYGYTIEQYYCLSLPLYVLGVSIVSLTSSRNEAVKLESEFSMLQLHRLDLDGRHRMRRMNLFRNVFLLWLLYGSTWEACFLSRSWMDPHAYSKPYTVCSIQLHPLSLVCTKTRISLPAFSGCLVREGVYSFVGRHEDFRVQVTLVVEGNFNPLDFGHELE